MSLFSRRSMIVVAGCALTVPLAAGTASAAFDLHGDSAAPVEDASASAEGSVSSSGAHGSTDSSVGNGAVEAEKNGARVNACAADAQPCAQVRGSGIPEVASEQAPDTGDLEGGLSGEASRDGASADGSTSAGGEDLNGSADASTDGGSVEADTPVGNGAANVETESFDIYVR